MNMRKILLVEDNNDDIDLTLRALKKSNILNDVVVAKDGVEALDYIFGTGTHAGRDICDAPAIILLDLNLPKINGIEVLKKVREDKRTRIIPVIILTSSKEEQDLITGYELGCNSYIRKPVNFSQFSDSVKQLGMYWLLLNEPPPATSFC